MAIPSLVISIEGDLALVECFGVQRSVNLLLMPEPVAVGDYVFIMANTYAVERVSPEVAAESLAYLKEVLDEPAAGDAW
jgi:hydrogenase expression/formation protein HypC